MIEIEIEDNEALAARDEGLKELVYKKPELLEVQIGPPIKRRRLLPPSEDQGHHMQRFPPYGNLALPPTVPLQQSFLLGDHLGSMAVSPQIPPPQSFGLVDQSGNMAVPPPLALPYFRFGNTDEPVNMAAPPSPQPYFFIFGDGHQPTNMDFQTQQDDGLVEGDNGDEPVNTAHVRLAPC